MPRKLIYELDVKLAKIVRDYERQWGTWLNSTQTLNNIVIAAAFIGTSLTLPSLNANNEETTDRLQLYSEVAIFFGALAFVFAISSSVLISSLQRLCDDIYDDLVTLDTLQRLKLQYIEDNVTKKEINNITHKIKVIESQKDSKRNHFRRAIRAAMAFTLLGLFMLSVSLILIINSKTIIATSLITIATIFIVIAAAAACVLFNLNHIVADRAEKGWNVPAQKKQKKTGTQGKIEITETEIEPNTMIVEVDGEDHRKERLPIEG